MCLRFKKVFSGISVLSFIIIISHYVAFGFVINFRMYQKRKRIVLNPMFLQSPFDGKKKRILYTLKDKSINNRTTNYTNEHRANTLRIIKSRSMGRKRKSNWKFARERCRNSPGGTMTTTGGVLD